MSILGEFLNFRQETYAAMDAMIYGTSYIHRTDRKWYNPMRYILGIEKLKRLDPIKCAIDPKDWKGHYRSMKE